MIKEVSGKEFDPTDPQYLGLTYKGYNHMPEPYEEIGLEEFLNGVHDNTYSMKAIGHGQVYLEKGSRFYWDAQFYFFALSAYAVLSSFSYNEERSRERQPDKFEDVKFFKKKHGGNFMRFFKLGCQHKWVELSQKECRQNNISHWGMCFHVNRCTKCGHLYSYDSSG